MTIFSFLFVKWFLKHNEDRLPKYKVETIIGKISENFWKFSKVVLIKIFFHIYNHLIDSNNKRKVILKDTFSQLLLKASLNWKKKDFVSLKKGTYVCWRNFIKVDITYKNFLIIKVLKNDLILKERKKLHTTN